MKVSCVKLATRRSRQASIFVVLTVASGNLRVAFIEHKSGRICSILILKGPHRRVQKEKLCLCN